MATNNLADYWKSATRNPVEISPEDIAAIRQTFQVAGEVRPIPSAPGYAVSDCGRVFTSMACSWKKGERLRERKQMTHVYGYRSVSLQVNKTRRLDTVHRLVAEAFLPLPQEGQNVVRHLNGDPSDNRVANLAWGTQADNMADCVRHGRTLRGLKNTNAKLNPKRVAIAVAMAGEGFSHKAIAAFFGVNTRSIDRAVSGEQWGEVDATPS